MKRKFETMFRLDVQGSQADIQRIILKYSGDITSCPHRGENPHCIECQSKCRWFELFMNDLTSQHIGRKKTLRVIGGYMRKFVNGRNVSMALNIIKNRSGVSLLAYVTAVTDRELIGNGHLEDGQTCIGSGRGNSHMADIILKSPRHVFLGVALLNEFIEDPWRVLYNPEKYRDKIHGVGRGIIEFHGQHTISLYNIYARYARKELIEKAIIDALRHTFGNYTRQRPPADVAREVYYNGDGICLRFRTPYSGRSLRKGRCVLCGRLTSMEELVKVKEDENSFFLVCTNCYFECTHCGRKYKAVTMRLVHTLDYKGHEQFQHLCPWCMELFERCQLCGIYCEPADMYDIVIRGPGGPSIAHSCVRCLYTPAKEGVHRSCYNCWTNVPSGEGVIHRGHLMCYGCYEKRVIRGDGR